LIEPVASASSVNIKSQGWHIFGGYRNNLGTSQKLESVNSTWKEGQPVLETRISGQCVVQVASQI